MTDSRANGPWKEMYNKMNRECPQNDTERHVLKMLGAGADVEDCLEYWESVKNSGESFLEFMKRADEWEKEEIRRRMG